MACTDTTFLNELDWINAKRDADRGFPRFHYDGLPPILNGHDPVEYERRVKERVANLKEEMDEWYNNGRLLFYSSAKGEFIYR